MTKQPLGPENEGPEITSDNTLEMEAAEMVGYFLADGVMTINDALTREPISIDEDGNELLASLSFGNELLCEIVRPPAYTDVADFHLFASLRGHNPAFSRVPEDVQAGDTLGIVPLESFPVSKHESQLAETGLSFSFDRASNAIEVSLVSNFVDDRREDAIKEDRIEVRTDELPLSSDYVATREAEFLAQLLAEHPQLQQLVVTLQNGEDA